MTRPVPEEKLRLGGMALRNGLLVHGPSHWAAAGGRALRGRHDAARTLGREAAVAAVSLLPALAALRSGDLASYHGVEHKSIAAYEDDGSAADATKEHDRCGSNLVAPMLASTAGPRRPARRAATVPATVVDSSGATRCDPQRSCSLDVSAATSSCS